MKRIFLSLMVLVFVGSTCFAYPAVDRATKGVTMIATSPLKVHDAVKTEMHAAKFMPFGIVGGTAKGTFYMGKQIVNGAWKVVSVPYYLVK
jgi:hypothetical protein